VPRNRIFLQPVEHCNKILLTEKSENCVYCMHPRRVFRDPWGTFSGDGVLILQSSVLRKVILLSATGIYFNCAIH
jgi:hypothetical protein